VRLLDWSTGTLLRVIGWKAGKETAVTEEEIGVLVEQATDAGVFEEAEGEMMESVLRLGDRVVASAMTPRPDVVWLDLSDPFETTLERIKSSGYSRYPVARDDLDGIVGIVDTNALLCRCLNGEPFDLTASVQTPEIVPETMPLLDLLGSSREARAGMVLVADEFGGILGIVTEADLFYALVGDTRATVESGERDAIQREDGSWLLSGRLSVGDMQRILEVDDLPEDEQGRYHTLAGFILTRLGHIPQSAESFTWSEHRFEIVDMDGHRVDKVLVTPLPRNIYEMSAPD
jgi:putative hemolysin